MHLYYYLWELLLILPLIVCFLHLVYHLHSKVMVAAIIVILVKLEVIIHLFCYSQLQFVLSSLQHSHWSMQCSHAPARAQYLHCQLTNQQRK